MVNSKNTVLVGFIDLLTGFLASSFVLMLIFSYSMNKGGDISGGPRDYIFYNLIIEGPEIDNINLKLFVKPPGQKWVQTSISERGDYEYDENKFLDLDHDKFFAWGPSIQIDDVINLDKRVYNIYGVSLLNESNGEWKFGVLFYDNKELDDKAYSEYNSQQFSEIINRQYTITHNTRTRVDSYSSDERTISLGGFDDFTIQIKVEDQQ